MKKKSKITKKNKLRKTKKRSPKRKKRRARKIEKRSLKRKKRRARKIKRIVLKIKQKKIILPNFTKQINQFKKLSFQKVMGFIFKPLIKSFENYRQ